MGSLIAPTGPTSLKMPDGDQAQDTEDLKTFERSLKWKSEESLNHTIFIILR
jgi:hypothetical protein